MKTNIHIILILIIFTVVLCPILANASKVLFFTPTRVLLNDQKKVEVMNVTNLSDITRAYKISIEDQIMTYEGVTAPVDSFEYSAKRMLRFAPRDFILKPGERQAVRVMARIRANTEDGDYHTHIRFLEDASQRNILNPPEEGKATIGAPLAYEALIPAIISKGSVRTNIGLKDAVLSKNPNNGNYVIDTVVTREGNGQGIAYMDTNYIAPNGEVTSVTPRRTVYIYRELQARKKAIEFTLSDDLPKGGQIKLSVFDDSKKGASPVNEVSLPLP